MSFENPFANRATTRMFLSSILACFVLLTTQSAIAQTVVFINEIHYDNASTDSGEAVEVAGPAGTDLTGWSVVLYNGSNSLVYGTHALAGSIPDQNGGYGTVSLAIAGLQNGSPDGLALVDCGGTAVQFLSYEGSIAAGDGPAVGQTSIDIGVVESSSTPVGDSLQLSGTGAVYEDFSWAVSSANTFGNPNTGQTFSGDGGGDGVVECGGGGAEPAPPGLKINEIDYDQPGTDSAEFVELSNTSSTAIDLSQYTLQLMNGSGGGAVQYGSFALPSTMLGADEYYVICTSATTVANCDLEVLSSIQNGPPDAVALLEGSDVVDTVSYEGDVPGYTEGSGAGLADASVAFTSISRFPNGADTDQNNVDLSLRCATPGLTNATESADCPDPLPTPATQRFIHEIQGAGPESPLAGDKVEITGIVVGNFQDLTSGTNNELNGFFVQEEDLQADADATTSEGIFVFDGSSPAVPVSVGDQVTVVGTVSEFFGMTQLTSPDVSVQSRGNALPTAAVVVLPLTAADDLEAVEGMLVTVPQPLVISAYHNFDRYGEIVLTTHRYMSFTAEFEPDTDGNTASNAEFALNSIMLDDGRTNQNPDPAIHPNGNAFTMTNLFRGGDIVENVTGVLNYSFSLYRIHATIGADYTAVNERTAAPDPVGGDLRVASANVLNYFTTLDEGGNLCGPTEALGCRGADNADELTRQRDKIIASLAAIDADIVGLVEIENHMSDVALLDLVAGLNGAVGPDTYDAIATGPIGTDAIKVALIYKPETATPVGDYAILDASFDPLFVDDKNRPALAQSFMDNATGGVFTVAVNHFKSKGSSCSSIGDPDSTDGSGNCNGTRTDAATVLVNWLATDPTASGNSDVLVIGDLNAYDKETPIDALVDGGYVDLVDLKNGEYAYSYVFSGRTGYLDHALASASLTPQVTGTTEWHINADEPDLINYDTSFKQDAQDALYAPDAYRSSDHDPVIVGLATCERDAPIIDEIILTPDVLWPANHKYVDVSAEVFASDDFDLDIAVELVSVTSSEPDNGKGDGNTVNDVEIVDDFNFRLRAERAHFKGHADDDPGRIYTVTYQATDSCGNYAIGEAVVNVPLHGEKKKKSKKSKKGKKGKKGSK